MARLEDGIETADANSTAVVYKCFCEAETLSQRSLAYGQLSELAENVDRLLTDSGVRHGDTVALLLHPDELTVAVILGVLKCRCTFLCLDPDEAVEFNSTVITRSKSRWAILSARLESQAVTFGMRPVSRLTLNGASLCLLGQTSSDTDAELGPIDRDEQMAYIMFTSGSTGVPKIVRVAHSSIRPNIVDLRLRWGVTSADAILLASPLTFDPSMVEMFVALTTGATLVILCHRHRTSPVFLRRALFHEDVLPTILQLTPSLLGLFGRETLKDIVLGEQNTVRVLVLGGEAFPLALIRDVRHPKNTTRIFNIYGVTEVSCWATIKEIEWHDLAEGDHRVDIGSPLSDTSVKLSARGDGSAEVVMESWTRLCFVDDETAPKTQRNTGDLAEMDSRGRIYLLGRSNDEQLKRSGKRINLTQIEKAIGSERRCAVVYDVDRDVVCCAVEAGQEAASASTIHSCRLAAQTLLPSYSRPDRWKTVAQLPLSKHCKLDRRAVLELFVMDYSTATVRHKNDLVSNLLHELSTFFRLNMLKEQQTTFSTIGLKSLKAVELVTHLEERFGVVLPSDVMNRLLEPTFTVAQFLLLAQSIDISDHEPASKVRKLATYSDPGHANNTDAQLSLTLSWCWDSGKCVDASPVTDGQRVFIGSHSGVFAALSIRDGGGGRAELWRFVAPHRIEATAAITSVDVEGREKLVVFGCHDGCVYFLDHLSGEQYWRFATGDIVKCEPITHSKKPVVFIGSHDKTFYCLDYQVSDAALLALIGSVVFCYGSDPGVMYIIGSNCTFVPLKRVSWSLALDGGIVSTACLNCSNTEIFVATLSGTVWRLNADTGSELSKHTFSKPIFAPISLLNNETLAVPCVDGYVYFLNADDLRQIGSHFIGGSLFGGVCCWNSDDDDTNGLMIVGSSNRTLYALRLTSEGAECACEPVWTMQGSAPFVRSAFLDQRLGCAITTDGSAALFDRSGSVVLRFKLKAECFSSPILVDNAKYLVVGCRDNFVYCYKIG